jgi:hypothetical protein
MNLSGEHARLKNRKDTESAFQHDVFTPSFQPEAPAQPETAVNSEHTTDINELPHRKFRNCQRVCSGDSCGEQPRRERETIARKKRALKYSQAFRETLPMYTKYVLSSQREEKAKKTKHEFRNSVYREVVA